MRLLLLLVVVVLGAVVAVLLWRRGRGHGDETDAVDRLIGESNVLEQYGRWREAIELLEAHLKEHGEDATVRQRLEELRG
jgi:hypothetical protein